MAGNSMEGQVRPLGEVPELKGNCGSVLCYADQN